MVTLSLVVPCFNEQESIPIFYKESSEILKNLEQKDIICEIIFVDDGSKDDTAKIIEKIGQTDDRVHYIVFSRNFGKEAAMLAGLREAKGAYVVLLDADLQHPPLFIPQMLNAVSSGEFDCAGMLRTRTGDSRIRSFFSRCFYRIISKLTEMEVTDGEGDFRLMSRPYVDAILSLSERSRFSKGIFPWIGFRTKWFEYENVQRIVGKTKWPFKKLFLYSMDGIIGFSSKLLSVASVCGILAFLASLAVIIFSIIRKLVWGVPVDGWTTLICVISFFSGVQLLTIGILGQYLAKTYNEVKQRPHYLIKDKK
ncbi:MAG: glycosyltransferase family 2 protein [Termitinemataceae bacterium]|nr:MAG: glycosyltransferase family 2 protein [Termitinemataceae bacterium]